MSLPIKKIYVDTKYRVAGSRSSSDFTISLPISLTFPENTAFYIDDVCIPHSWYSVEENVNDKLYVFVIPLEPDAVFTGAEFKIVKIESGNYNGPDLALEMQTKIRAAINNTAYPLLLDCTYNTRKNNIIISPHYADWRFSIFTPTDLAKRADLTGLKIYENWFGEPYDITNPNDMNEIIGNTEGSRRFYTTANPFISSFLNLTPVRNIYIHSSLGNYNTIGARGETSIVKKVPVTANINEVIFDQVLVGNDFGDCSKQTMRTISFQLKDVRGNYIDFHGADLSFSIIFSKTDVSG
jgi:hypothetical protein